jgi:hypothetical protein
LIGKPIVQSRVEASRQGKHSFVAIEFNDIAHAIAHGLAARASGKMFFQRLLQRGINVSLEVI